MTSGSPYGSRMDGMRMLGRMHHPVRGFLNGAAAIASIVGLLILLSANPAGTSVGVTLGLYATTLVAMFTVSSLYHSVPWSGVWKTRMRRLDHSAIFLVVAGTYTPIAVVHLDGAWRSASLLAVWGAAIVGIVLKLVEREIRLGPSITIQMMMGWAAVIPLVRFADRLGADPLVLLAIGGILYSVGVVFLVTGKPRLFPTIFSHHELFHVVVVAATLINFLAILNHVVPAAA